MTAITLVSGRAEGELLVLDEPLSLWGGLDPVTGRIVERRHPQHGQTVTGRVLLMPSGRGSSSSTTVLAEAIRRGTGPAAIVLREPDGIVALGAIVAGELYGTAVPVVICTDAVPVGRVRVVAADTAATIQPV
jgi:predicted aconitase with swiveling domain